MARNVVMATLVLMLSWLANRVVDNNKVVLVSKTLGAMQLVVVVMAEKLVLFKQRLMRSLLRPVIPAGRARVTI